MTESATAQPSNRLLSNTHSASVSPPRNIIGHIKESVIAQNQQNLEVENTAATSIGPGLQSSNQSQWSSLCHIFHHLVNKGFLGVDVGGQRLAVEFCLHLLLNKKNPQVLFVLFGA